MRSAIFSNSAARSFVTVALHAGKALAAAATALAICSGDAPSIATSGLLVAGSSTSCFGPLPTTSLPLMSNFVFMRTSRWASAALLRRPGKTVRQQDRDERHDHHHDRDHV